MSSGKTGKPHSIIQFNKATGKLEEPSLLLKTRSGKVLGNIQYTNLQFSFVGKGLDNLSFDVHKVVDGKECEFWDKLIDLSIVDYKGYGQFEAHVTLNDENESIKSVTCESLETELGQHIIHEMHINDDVAITNSDENTEFVPTTLCDFAHPEYSLIHRVLNDKAPHWTVVYCSPQINIDGTVYDANSVQRTFTISGQTPYDFFDGEVSQEFSVIFTYDTYNRKVYCYNLEECVYDKNTRKAIDGYHCINGVFYDENDLVVADTSNLAYCEGIGNDTNIFVSKSKLANSLSMDSEQGSVKNCFYVTGGDDIITNMVGAANLTGNEIFIFGNFQRDEMSNELNTTFNKYMNDLKGAQEDFTRAGGVYIWDPTCKYDKETNTCRDKNDRVLTDAMYIPHSGYDPDKLWGKVHVLDPLAYYNESENACYDKYGKSFNLDDNTRGNAFYQEPGLYAKYCHLVDQIQYLEHGMTPIDDTNDTTTASNEKNKIVDYFNKNYNKVLITNSCSSEAFAHVTNNIESMIQVVCNLKYTVKILSGESYPQTCYTINEKDPDGIWRGYVRLEKETDTTDFVEFNLSVNVRYVDIGSNNTDENLAYCKQKIKIAIAKMDIAELDFTNPEMSDFELRTLLKKYNLASLKEFYTGFESCVTLLKSLYSNAELEENDFFDEDDNIINATYESDSHIIATKRYTERRDIAKAVYDERLAEVTTLKEQKDDLEKDIEDEQNKYNLETYLKDKHGEELGTKLWKELHSYIREDEYNNSNYISDGLSDSECLEKAKKLLDAAKNELSKACMIQYTVSGDINNIFSQKQLECLHEKFDLFNYIRAEIDEKIYKLRLTEIRFSYDTPEKLEVTFSQQVESVDKSASDTQKLLEQSASIATSYSSTIRQAEQGSNAFNTFNQIRQEGLDSSMFLLKNSNSEEQTFGNAGLFCRETTDGGLYSQNQLAITHNGIYMTKDGFNSINTAFGKFKFENEWVYGINADVVLGNLIIGDHIKVSNEKGNVEITGDGIEIKSGLIKSANYVENESGSMLDLTNGNFDFAGGKLIYNDGKLSIGGWTVYGDTLSSTTEGNTISLNAKYGSIYSIYNDDEGEDKVVLTSGYIGFYKNGTKYMKLHTTYWTDKPNVYGVGINSEADSKFISFGNKKTESDKSYITPLVLNYGLNPNNDKQDVIIYGSTLITGETTIKNRLYFNDSFYLDSFHDDNNTDTGIACVGDLYVEGNISTNNGDVALDGHNLWTHDIKWTVNGNARTDEYDNGQERNLASVAWVSDNYTKKDSDERVKCNFSPLPNQIDDIFDSFNPRQYEYKDGLKKAGFYFGDTAQHIENIFKNNNLNPSNYAITGERRVDMEGKEKDYITNDTFHYIDQNNVIWLCVDQIQKLKKRVNELEKLN